MNPASIPIILFCKGFYGKQFILDWMKQFTKRSSWYFQAERSTMISTAITAVQARSSWWRQWCSERIITNKPSAGGEKKVHLILIIISSLLSPQSTLLLLRLRTSDSAIVAKCLSRIQLNLYASLSCICCVFSCVWVSVWNFRGTRPMLSPAGFAKITLSRADSPEQAGWKASGSWAESCPPVYLSAALI